MARLIRPRVTGLLGLALLLPALLGAGGCSSVSREDAIEALEQAAVATQSWLLAATVIELGTGFDPALAPSDAAQALAAHIVSETGCATAVATDEQVDIDFGTLDAPCSYRGRPLSGCAQLRIIGSGAGQVEVSHFWVDGSTDVCHGDDLTDGALVLDGTATVTWTAGETTRDVVLFEVIWRTSEGDFFSTATGDLQQSADDIGVSLAGTQTWTTEGEDWTLVSQGIEADWLAAVPFAGTHTVSKPSGPALTVSYSEADGGGIRAVVEGGGKRFTLTVLE